MKNKDQKLRKNALLIDTSNFAYETSLKELFTIRGDYKTISEKIDPFADYEKVCQLMAKKKCALSISGFKNSLVFARIFDNQLLECIKFKIVNAYDSGDFEAEPAEMFVKYLVLAQNFTNKRIENLFIDFFSQNTSKINLDALNYAWVLNESEGQFTLKFVRIYNSKTKIVQDIGPWFILQIEKEFYCGDELYEKAFEVVKPKTQRNVSTTATKDKVGKLYIDKQDLKDINLKKSRAYRKQDK